MKSKGQGLVPEGDRVKGQGQAPEGDEVKCQGQTPGGDRAKDCSFSFSESALVQIHQNQKQVHNHNTPNLRPEDNLNRKPALLMLETTPE